MVSLENIYILVIIFLINSEYAMSEQFKNINNILVKVHSSLASINPKALPVLEVISKYQTTNVSEMSRKTGIPVSTLHKFLDHLFQYQIKIGIYIDLYTIGLKLYFLVIYKPDQHAIKTINEMIGEYSILNCDVADGNLSFMKICLPDDAQNNLIELLEDLKSKKDIENYDLYVVTPNIQPAISFRNYDSDKRAWRINWDSVLNIINMGSFKDLDERLKSIKSTKQWLDDTDITILKMLDDNVFTALSDIQRKANEPSFQKIYYHYIQHVEKKHIIMSYRIRFEPYEEPTHYTILYVMLSGSYDMAKFIDALTNQIYVYGISRVLGEPSLLIELPVNPIMKTGLNNLLERLKEQKFVRDYKIFYADHATEKPIPFNLYNTSTETWLWKKQVILK
jgi:DNA-binding Lrp family transcriptional regulator